MTWIEQMIEWIKTNTGISYIPIPGLLDILDIAFVAFIFYKVLVWFRRTRAWTLLKGVIVLIVIALLASLLKMNITSWLLQNTMVYGVLALVVIFQPEIRNALEKIGHGSFISWFTAGTMQEDQIEEKTIDEIIRAMEAMAAVKTGALICVEQDVRLGEYEQTGITVDAVVTSQLLINIFEKNTPLHDGAVIVHDNRVTSATCYLPLSDNMEISKEMGTRHRAALGLSEVSDAIVLIVSEETGAMSVAAGGQLYRNVNESFIRQILRNDQEGQHSGSLLGMLKSYKNTYQERTVHPFSRTEISKAQSRPAAEHRIEKSSPEEKSSGSMMPEGKENAGETLRHAQNAPLWKKTAAEDAEWNVDADELEEAYRDDFASSFFEGDPEEEEVRNEQ